MMHDALARSIEPEAATTRPSTVPPAVDGPEPPSGERRLPSLAEQFAEPQAKHRASPQRSDDDASRFAQGRGSAEPPPASTKSHELDAATVATLLARYRLTRDEWLGYFAEKLDRIEQRVAEVLDSVSIAERDDDDVLLRPRAASRYEWQLASESRDGSLRWYREHVALSGPFASARPMMDVARRMRGQNPAELDVFTWMLPQRPEMGAPAPSELCERPTLGRAAASLPQLHPTRVRVSGAERTYDLFSGNDYLGLRVDPRVRAAAMEAVAAHGIGSGGSRMLSGTSELHRRLEQRIAELAGTEDAVVLNSGYHANLAVLSSFGQDGVVVFSDRLNHASIIDGLRMSEAQSRVFEHNDVDDLVRVIEQHCAESPRGRDSLRTGMIVVEAVYSMDGDVAPVRRITEVARHYGLALHVDEAHSALVMGARGGGICEHLDIDPSRVHLHMGTLSKAFGGEGGYVAARRPIVEALKLRARQFWFSTALPASSMAGALAALDVATAEPERRERLWRNAAFVRDELAAAGFDLCGSTTWIVPVLVGDELRTALLQQGLRDEGILASAVFAPAVARGQERIRLSISSEHTPYQLEHLVGVFRKLAR
ncbi:MAG: pyridoxal phosphate-dependent aminotransferase family protein [Deltaproteobacteria bacterium]|nr:pyridoxal phosphate-dependent aminotransferase family protein [Deltaproteobacteria bacterium]